MKSPIELRLELARGHWSLGEYPESIDSLERAAAGIETDATLHELADTFAEELERLHLPEPLARRLCELRDRLAPRQLAAEEPQIPVATSTMAELLAEQGHTDRALQVADEVLRRDPADERARAIRDRIQTGEPEPERVIVELERWLGNLATRQQGGARV